MWKIATFNVNGIRARMPIVIEWLRQRRPNVLCLQEIKCPDDAFPVSPFQETGYTVSTRGEKSFNGVAILTTGLMTETIRGFEDGQPDTESRLIAARIDGIWVINTYIPQGRHPEDPAFQRKLEFFHRLKSWFQRRFDPRDPIIWTGDMNVAPEEIDVFDPERLDGSVGFHPDERKALADLTSWGFTDLFRKHHPEKRQFTFWDYRLPKGVLRNLGWRLDHILATDTLAKASTECVVDEEPRSLDRPSDHTPVWADLDFSKLDPLLEF